MPVGRKASKIRKRIGYDPDAPRCSNCKHFRKSHLELKNSTPQYHQSRCKEYDVIIEENGCCDYWVCKRTGVTLILEEPKNGN